MQLEIFAARAAGSKYLRRVLLDQWKHLNPLELDKIRSSRRQIALLVQRQTGIAHELVEHYLRNIERTLPVV